MKVKCFVIEYVFDNDPVRFRFYSYEDQVSEAEQFCALVKAQGGLINIRIRDIDVPN